MRNRIIVEIVAELYREFLRDLVVAYVEQSDNDLDNMIVSLLDAMFLGRPKSKLRG